MSHTLPTKTNANSNFRELVFEGYASDKEVVSLMLKDTSVDGTKEGYYKVPLYTSNTVDQQSSDADIELVHIYPFLYDTPEQQLQSASPVTSGFIYIYVDGYLWRELQVIEPEDFDAPALFSDVNLYWQKGFLSWKKSANKPNSRPQGTRAATCKPTSSILVPHKLNGNEVSVEIAWSEVQWSWEQILLFGGFNEQDPRLNTGTPLADEERHCPAPGDAAALRAQRMIKLDNLGQFTTGYNDQGKVVNTPTLHQKLHLPERDKIAQVPIFDGIHVARMYVVKIQNLVVEIEALMNHLSGVNSDTGEIDYQQRNKYELAVYMLQTFYLQTDAVLDKDIEIQSSGEKLVESDEDAIDFANKLKEWRTECLDEEAFFEFLQEKTFRELAENIAELTDELINFLDQESLAAGFTECFKDYAHQTDLRFFEAYDLLTDLFLVLKPHPAAQIAQINRDKEFWHTLSSGHRGQDFILQCLAQHPSKPGKEIAQFLFPKPTGNKLSEYEKRDFNRFELKLASAKIEKIHKQEELIDWNEGEQLGRRLSQVIFGLAVSVFEIPDIAHKLSSHEGTLGQQKSATQAATNATQQQYEQTQKALKEAELARDEALDELTKKEAEYEQRKSELSRLTPEEHQLKAAELDAKIQVERARLQRLETKFAAAKASVTRAQKQVSTFVKVNNAWHKYPFAKLIDAKADVLQPLMRLVDISTPGHLVEVEMRVSDYINGNFPKGYMPLDPKSRQLSAEKQVKELNQVIRANRKRNVNIKYGGASHKVSLEDVLNLNKRLELLTQSLDRAQTTTFIESKEKVIAYLVKATGADLSAEASAARAKQIYDDTVQNAKYYSTELENQHTTIKNLAERTANLEKWQNKVVTEAASSQSLKRGMVGILGALYIFEIANVRQVVSSYDFKFDRKFADLVGTASDLAAIHYSVHSAITQMRSGLLSPRQYAAFEHHRRVFGSNSAQQKYGPTFSSKASLMKWTSRLNLLASAYSATISAFDAYYAYKRGDVWATTGNLLVTAGFAGMAIDSLPMVLAKYSRAAVMLQFGRLSIYGLIAVLIGYGVLYLIHKDPLENWLTVCPWGKNAFEGGEKKLLADNPTYSWQAHPEYALHALYDALFAPSIMAESQVMQLNTFSRVADKISKRGKFHIVNFNMQVPGHIPASQLGYLDLEFDIKPVASNKPWQSLLSTAAKGQASTAIDHFWEHVKITVSPQFTGFQLQFDEIALYPYFDKLNCTKLKLRMRCTKYPLGKGQTISPNSSQEFRLPAPDRDQDGNISEARLWSEQTVEVEIDDYGLSAAGLLQRLLN
ncbi:hypothetical protein [Pseudoalteromonas piscicida]|uniref:Uncharacterized protein n=1 Tax=Pseudoalteromonas piscicida TaxID=43662 RepID=A0A2A5JU99_PSEO7|nr:hypothetical protein [Pseudoalteromonas piscicida]PCK33054.1 hypothetical protein CEX98_03900 [Pseudoalteromonas piscicida]